MDPPDWDKALEYVDKGIELREPANRIRFAFYEFNRAICLAGIELDRQVEESDENTKQRILADLRAARHYRWFEESLKEQDTLNDWFSRNGLTVTQVIERVSN